MPPSQADRIPLHVYQVLEEEYLSLHGPMAPDPLTVHLPHGGRLDPAACRPPGSSPADAGRPGDECRWHEVEAARDWAFRRGHVRHPALLAAALLPRRSPQFADIPHDLMQLLPAYDWSRENLKDYIYKGIDHGLLRDLLESYTGDDEWEAPEPLRVRLEAGLNELLADGGLYHPDRFAEHWLSPASRGLVELMKTLPGQNFVAAAAQARHDSPPSPAGGPGAPEERARLAGIEDLKHFNRVLLEDAFPGIEKIFDIRFAAVCQRLHYAKRSALCLSGGGIRSGTFALGLLQGLARHNLLKEFDYLSTVSGGGYIGSWLTAWLHRHPEGLKGVTRELANCPPASKVDPEPAPLLHLRRYSNFLTPRAGLLTADTWTFVGIYLRNLLINWMVFIPLLVAALLLPRLLLTLTLAQPAALDAGAGLGASLNNFSYHYGRYVFLVAGFLSGVWALAYINFNRPGLREQLRRSRYWRERSDQRSFLRWCLAPLVASAALLTTYFAWSSERHLLLGDRARVQNPWWLIAFGLAFIAGGYLVSAFVLRSRVEGAGQAEPAEPEAHKLRQSTGRRRILFALFVAALLAGLLFYGISRGALGNPVIGYGDKYERFNWLFTQSVYYPFGWLYWRTELYVCFAVPLFLLVFWGATTLFVGLSSVSPVVSDEDREWWSRLAAWLLIVSLVWVAANALVIYAPLALLESPRLLTAAGGLSGLAALLLGRSARTPGGPGDQQKGSLVSTVIGKLLPLLAVLFVTAFAAALSLGTTYLIKALAEGAGAALPAAANGPAGSGWPRSLLEWMTNAPGFADYDRYISPAPNPYSKYPAADRAKLVHLNVLHHTSRWFTLALGVVLTAVGYGISRFVNLNIFSLHGGYRNRLIRAFLGASRPAGERRPNSFTGFDPKDNVHMHELRPGLLDEDDFPDPVKLSDTLADDAHPLSRYLAARGLTGNVADARQRGSAGDVAALRTDLNRVLGEESLYEQFAAEYLQTQRARDVARLIIPAYPTEALRKDLLRTDYHILLNRLVLEQAYRGLIKAARYPPPPYKLLHVVNTTLNLVGGDNLAWQQRKAEPFSISPLHCGCFRLGYRESRDYGGRDTGGISIGTAATISGAAASSNMGYYTTSPVISLLLTLFNVRLGWWLGNPGAHGRKTFRDPAPRSSVTPVISEAFGQTDDRNPYVYLTDGGHFENLGLYEMVLRRCRVIVCADAAEDAEYRFGDLGNAVRKIRIDLGVPIEFTRVPIYAERPPREEGRGLYAAVGKIRYSCVDFGAPDGVLIYIKPAVYGTEPRDVLEYKRAFPAFPHQSTGDQFFDEPQFESYRMLGSHVMDRLCGEGTADLDIRGLVEQAYEQLTGTREGFPATDPGLRDWLEAWLRDYAAPPAPP